jgi:hypothetical protein
VEDGEQALDAAVERGYALLGGIFFLVSALRLGRNASRNTGGRN